MQPLHGARHQFLRVNQYKGTNVNYVAVDLGDVALRDLTNGPSEPILCQAKNPGLVPTRYAGSVCADAAGLGARG